MNKYPQRKNKTSFKKGQPAWNRQNLYSECVVCNKNYRTNKSSLNKRRCCSKSCSIIYRKSSSESQKIYDLYLSGIEVKDLAKQFSRKEKNILSLINVRKHRKIGLSRASITKRWKHDKRCLICGWSRCIDAAHIIPAHQGGTMDENNLIPLCPNHHRLFDKKKLRLNEARKLSNVINNWEVYCARKIKIAVPAAPKIDP